MIPSGIAAVASSNPWTAGLSALGSVAGGFAGGVSGPDYVQSGSDSGPVTIGGLEIGRKSDAAVWAMVAVLGVGALILWRKK